ncbi:hypothetical protein SAMN06264364_10870 [Quadrisphaera granulorum]|uniref:Uncharacterized protein n=2 Tax=Quadrisphaera granulorum TaxID=317664 RepID=A0A316A960_9ACTN|nr:hypothetical protein BXY45_10870 [Quadrisphaera granulorum]SZE96302.1 hypothetical protein SAMN06264364_10870 [Quadrisphaera granulorum]
MVAALEVPVIYASGLAGLLAIVIAARPPLWSVVESWAAAVAGQDVEDVRTSQVRGLLTRTCLVTLVIFVVVLIPALAVQLKAAAPAWGLGLAVLLGAATGADGGRTRRVDLLQLTTRSASRRSVTVLASAAVVIAVATMAWWGAITAHMDMGWPYNGPDTAMPESEQWILPVTAGCSLLTGLALLGVDRRIRLRRALPGVEPAVDAALREVSRRRALLGAGAALVTLAAVLLSLSPTLTVAVGAPEILNPVVGQTAGLVGTVAVGAAMVWLTVGLLRWSHRAKVPADADADADSEV